MVGERLQLIPKKSRIQLSGGHIIYLYVLYVCMNSKGQRKFNARIE